MQYMTRQMYETRRGPHWAALLVASCFALGACPSAKLPVDEAQSGDCCGGRGLCLPGSFLEAKQAALLGRDSCAEPTMCVPNELRGHGSPPVCTASGPGAEGRCLPDCLPSVAARGDQLQRDGCGEHQRCVPCYDPLTGASTDACSVGSDPGPAQPPKVFAECCGELGRCVPQALVPQEQQSFLGHEGCAEDGTLCTPLDAIVKGKAYVPSSCLALGTQAEGRCLPACLPSIASQRSRLGQSTCADQTLCAPCFDPITGKPTGACSLGGDPGPKASPPVLAACCEGQGHCIPSTLLSEDERAQVGAEACQGASTLCVPDAFAAPDFQPAACLASAVGAEGRCLPDCLPQIGAQRDRLKQESCAAHQLCAPCVDPVTGKPTGACELGTDRGPNGVPVVFASCCGGNARCVPDTAVPTEQRTQLRRETCGGERDLCVPTEIAANPGFVPSRCVVSALQAEGRCLSECLGAVAERPGIFKQDGCSLNQVCVPCDDPVSGQTTGACAFAGDPGPGSPGTLLPQCCGGLGRCTPKAWVPSEQAGNFGLDSCTAGADVLCVAPREALSDPAFVPARCDDPTTGAEGRCLPKCLPAVAARASALSAASCGPDQLCAPCFDPISGASTGACDSPADPGSSKPPVTFEACCGASASTASGLCVPAGLIPAGTPELPKQGCAVEGSVCAPRALVNDPHASFPSCSSVGTDQGVCIESCYLNSLAQLVSFAGNCQTGSLCVACSLLGGAIGGCPAP